MVPDDQVHLGQLHVGPDGHQVEEPLPALGELGLLPRRQQGDELRRHIPGVDHDPLGRARVDAAAPEQDGGVGGVEGLVLVVPKIVPVQGVGHLGPEAIQVQIPSEAPHLLVGSEGQGDGPVGELRVFQQMLRHGHDRGDGGLVVAAQQGGAVGEDQILAHVVLQVRELPGGHDDALLPVQQDVPAVVVLQYPRPAVSAGGVGGRVHVGHQSEGLSTGRRGGHPAVEDALLLIQPHVRRADGGELVPQQVG